MDIRSVVDSTLHKYVYQIGGKIMFQFILNRLKEASTWRGLILMVTAAGVAVSDTQQIAIIAAGIALAGVVGAFLPDKK